MTAYDLPEARLEWLRCFSAGASDRQQILASATWHSDAAQLLMLAASHREAPANPALTLEYVDAADRCASELPWVPTVTQVLRADALRALGRMADAAAALDLAREGLGTPGLDIGDGIRLSGVVHVREGLAALLQSDLPAAIDSLGHGLAVVGDSPDIRAESEGALALCAFLVGRISECREHLEASRSFGIARARASSLPAAAAEALLGIELGAAQEWLQPLDWLRARAEGTEYHNLAVAISAVALEAAGHQDDAAEALWQLEATAHPGHDLARNLGLSAWLALQAGGREIASALTALRTVPSDAVHSICPAAWTARLLLETGDYSRSLAALSECHALGPAHAKRTLVYVLAVTAAAHAGLRDTASADAAFARALELAALTGLRRYIMTLPPNALAELLDRAATAELSGVSRRVVAEIVAMLPPTLSESAPLLSPRERVVLQHLADGISLHVVAWQLSVSHNTVKSQTRSIYRKLGVDSRGAAVERGRTLGFVE